MEETLELQYKKAFDTGKQIITSLKETEALYIIDKNMNIKVLFYYKPNTYFLSRSFSIPYKFECVYLDEPLTELCKLISNEFEGTDLLRSSLLVNDIDKTVNLYLIDSLIILVNRIENTILNFISLEIYNDLLIYNHKGLLRLVEKNKVIYYDILEPFNEINNVEDDLNKICINNTYPHNYSEYENRLLINELPLKNSILFNISVSADSLISYRIIGFDQKIDYSNKDILDFIYTILINLDCELIQEDLANIIYEFSLYYSNQYNEYKN